MGTRIDGVGLRSARGPVLLSIMLSTFLIAIDSTILSTAVPTIVRELGGFDQFPWLFSVYLLAQAATVPVYGKLADTFGRKPVMVVGIGVFLLGSVLCALAGSMVWLIAFRALQGVGAGAIMPTALTIAGDIYTVRERARAQGYLATVWAVASVAGPTLGGLFAQFVSWRWIFWVNVPIGVLALWLLWRAYREDFARRPRRIDYAGAVLLTGTLVLLVLGVLEGGDAWGWMSWPSLAVFGSGLVLLLAFLWAERRAEDPILAPWLLRRRIVSTSTLAALLIGVVMMGLVSFVPPFLEDAAGAAPIVSGLALATLTLGWPVTASLAGLFYLRIGFRRTALIGAVVTIAGTALVAGLAFAASVPLTALGCFVVGLGLGLVANPTLIAAQSSVVQHERGVVSGANALARSVGGAGGVAVFGAIANAVIAASGDGAALHAGASAVFAGIVIAAVALFGACLLLPTVPIQDEPA
ncbi:MFS transporter [Microbacterium sp. SORGH_AS_0888]|uniref:MFS transporter n=1 Tax=Microbacterium sp. SORGH_AS_0888 TaxID=3041791 RepID=UPI00277ED57F|nr:MFS transporter [Microbacterium sp. SORGH_AS_0888]MDQ1129180.1 EmrB/QacA subfamily drug resistance transporter [Microbacterium sp. SORGH_AS_0888]